MSYTYDLFGRIVYILELLILVVLSDSNMISKEELFL